MGALPRSGRARPLRGLAASGYLRLQHRAGPLSAVATTRGSWAGSARGGRSEDWCLPSGTRPLGTGLGVLYQGGCGSSCMGKGGQLLGASPHSTSPGAAPLHCGAAGQGHCGAQARWCQGAPAQGLETGGQGPGPCHSEWPTGHLSQAILAPFFILTVPLLPCIYARDLEIIKHQSAGEQLGWSEMCVTGVGVGELGLMMGWWELARRSQGGGQGH